jgi:hypothetical protein
MLWSIAVLLLILWLLGMVSSYTLGGFIHNSARLGCDCSVDPPHPRPKSSTLRFCKPRVILPADLWLETPPGTL